MTACRVIDAALPEPRHGYAVGPSAPRATRPLGMLTRLFTHPRLHAIARLVGRYVPRRLLHIDVLTVTELRAPLQPLRQRRGLRVREATRDDLPELARLFPTARRAMEKRLATGDAAFVGEASGRCVAMAWLAMTDNRDEPHKFCRFLLSPDTAWSYDVAVLPEWRLSGALPALLGHTFDFVLRGGRQRLCGYASHYNQASLRAHYSFGHRPVATVTVLNLFGLRLHRLRREGAFESPETHLSFLTRPVIDLRARATAGNCDRGAR